ncbi:MAG: hypothetical protein SGPRY_012227 [Prymnesium sp.]
MARRSLAAEEGIALLHRGVLAVKYGRHGKPHSTTFRLSDDEQHLFWQARRRATQPRGSRMIAIKAIQELRVGYESAVFKRSPKDGTREHLAFSLALLPRQHSADDAHPRESLDIGCSDEETFGLLVAAFRALLAEQMRRNETARTPWGAAPPSILASEGGRFNSGPSSPVYDGAAAASEVSRMKRAAPSASLGEDSGGQSSAGNRARADEEERHAADGRVSESAGDLRNVMGEHRGLAGPSSEGGVGESGSGASTIARADVGLNPFADAMDDAEMQDLTETSSDSDAGHFASEEVSASAHADGEGLMCGARQQAQPVSAATPLLIGEATPTTQRVSHARGEGVQPGEGGAEDAPGLNNGSSSCAFSSGSMEPAFQTLEVIDSAAGGVDDTNSFADQVEDEPSGDSTEAAADKLLADSRVVEDGPSSDAAASRSAEQASGTVSSVVIVDSTAGGSDDANPFGDQVEAELSFESMEAEADKLFEDSHLLEAGPGPDAAEQAHRTLSALAIGHSSQSNRDANPFGDPAEEPSSDSLEAAADKLFEGMDVDGVGNELSGQSLAELQAASLFAHPNPFSDYTTGSAAEAADSLFADMEDRGAPAAMHRPLRQSSSNPFASRGERNPFEADGTIASMRNPFGDEAESKNPVESDQEMASTSEPLSGLMGDFFTDEERSRDRNPFAESDVGRVRRSRNPFHKDEHVKSNPFE